MASFMLKELSNEIKGGLAVIYIKSMAKNQVPYDWKSANVTQIFKKGKKCDSSNYRPVSLTSHVCKILESIVKDSIINYIM